jgi:(heptosyl)LPS beta-1,4-glucosyltransferase
MSAERVTACLIVQDEQEHLPDALDSVDFCDEILVVDGGSTDRTVAIAREHSARVIEHPWLGFAVQRNIALDAATSEWIFELDADERVSPQLRESITQMLLAPSPNVNIGVCALRNRFLGGFLGPSAKYPAFRSRLFRRGAYRHDESRAVHEGIEPLERPAVLHGDLEHELAETWSEALRDTWHYARLEGAHIRPPRNPIAYLKGIVARPLAKLFYRTVVDGGWRDGWRGLLKILLDASSDALVWILVLVRASPGSASIERSDGTVEGQHFGRRPAGAPKVVAIAGRGEAAQVARRWLDALRSAGVDVALLSNDDRTDEEIPTQKLRHLRPLETMRALDIEMQIRTIHAVVAFGPLASFVRKAIPTSLRPEIQGLDIHANPVLTAERLHATVDRRVRHGSGRTDDQH